MSGALVILALLTSPAATPTSLPSAAELVPASVVSANHPGSLPPHSSAPQPAAWCESSDLADVTLDSASHSAASAAALVPLTPPLLTRASSGTFSFAHASLIDQHVRLQI